MRLVTFQHIIIGKQRGMTGCCMLSSPLLLYRECFLPQWVGLPISASAVKSTPYGRAQRPVLKLVLNSAMMTLIIIATLIDGFCVR